VKSRKLRVAVAGTLMAFTALNAAACSSTNTGATVNASATGSEDLGVQNTADNNQPAPVFAHSDIRDDGILIEAIEALGENTTTFAIANNGTLIWSCPSIGEPFHADDEITNPSQIDPDTNPHKPNSTAAVIPNMDPNEIFEGPNTGTYALCLTAKGVPYAHYAEENVDVVSAPAVWDPSSTNHIIVTGAPSMPVCNVEKINGKNQTVCTK
jgi:hypothetical protein